MNRMDFLVTCHTVLIPCCFTSNQRTYQYDGCKLKMSTEDILYPRRRLKVITIFSFTHTNMSQIFHYIVNRENHNVLFQKEVNHKIWLPADMLRCIDPENKIKLEVF